MNATTFSWSRLAAHSLSWLKSQLRSWLKSHRAQEFDLNLTRGMKYRTPSLKQTNTSSWNGRYFTRKGKKTLVCKDEWIKGNVFVKFQSEATWKLFFFSSTSIWVISGVGLERRARQLRGFDASPRKFLIVAIQWTIVIINSSLKGFVHQMVLKLRLRRPARTDWTASVSRVTTQQTLCL